MVEELLVKKIIELKEKILNEKGPLNLFALVQKDEQDNWDLVVSSNFFFGKEKEFLEYFVGELQRSLTNRELKFILRVILLKPDDNFVKNINSGMKIEKGRMVLENCTFNGMLVKKMYLFYSSRNPKK